MANTVSPIYEMTIPEVTQDNNAWGGHLNADLAGSIPSSATGLDGIIAVPRIIRVSPTVGAGTTITVSNGTYKKFTVNQVTTISFTGWAVDTTPGKWGQRVILVITGGGDFTVTWPSAPGFNWLSGTAPVLSKGTGVDIIEVFTVDNGTTLWAAHHSIADILPVNSVTYNGAGTSTIDLSKGRLHKVVVAGGISSFAISNVTKNTPTFRLLITNGGSQVLTWPGSVVWLSGAVPTLQTAGVDELHFMTPDLGTTWYGARVDPVPTKQAARVHLNVNQTLNSLIVLNWADPAEFDNVPTAWNPANVTRLTIASKTYGRMVVIMAQVTGNDSENQNCDLQIRKDGTTVIGRFNLSLDDEGQGNFGGPVYQVMAMDFVPASTSRYYEVLGHLGNEGNHVAVAGVGTWFSVAEV